MAPVDTRRYPVQTLAAELGLSVFALCRDQGASGTTYQHYRDHGLRADVAERWARAYGLAAPSVWTEMVEHQIEDEKERRRAIVRKSNRRWREKYPERARAVMQRYRDSIQRSPSNVLVACECGCGTRFPRLGATGRPRRFVTGHNLRPQKAAS